MCDPVEQDFHSRDRVDDPKIGSSDMLLRHLCMPAQIAETNDGLRISSQAFRPKKGEPGTSIDHECLLIKNGMTAADRAGLMPNSYGMVGILAHTAREHSGGVAWTPKPEEPKLGSFASKPNPFHGEIITPISKANFRSMAAKADLLWVKPGERIARYER